jgi:hypothetical protein
MREGVGKGLPGHVHPKNLGRDLAHEILGEPRLQALGLESGIADGLAAERIEAGGEVAVHAMGLDERHRGGHGAEQDGRRLGCGRCPVASLDSTGIKLADTLDKRVRLEEILGRLLEERSPRRVDCLRGGQVLREELLNEPGVEVLELLQSLV